MKKWFLNGHAFLTQKQGSILSAAFIVMSFVVVSRILGLIKLRVLAHYFGAPDLSLYFAAFFPSDTFYEVIVSGSLYSAFIPVFATLLTKGEKAKAWYVAGITQTTVLVIFLIFAAIVMIFAQPIAASLAPDLPSSQHMIMASLTRFLLLAQGFFVLSFFLSAIQETTGRFLVPALAPIFYNVGIIAGSILLSGLGIWGAAIGAVVGAFLHFVIQLPFARQLGFRFVPKIDLKDQYFRKISILAAPRMLELGAWRAARGTEVFLSFLISRAAYAHFTLANTLQLVPIALFGYSFAKATLPTLSAHAARHDKEAFSKTFAFAIGQIFFFVMPLAVTLAVLRIPIVRLAFGAGRSTWEDTLQIGYAVSAFAVGIVAQAVLQILNRSFYALQDTRTPTTVSLVTVGLYVALAISLVRVLHADVWGIALAFSVSTILQVTVLCLLLNRRMRVISRELLGATTRVGVASALSGGVMFLLLKILDQAVWDKRLSFLGKIGFALPTGFKQFVLDTRYTTDLLMLTIFVISTGIFVYLLVAAILRVREVEMLARMIQKLLDKRIAIVPSGQTTEEVAEPLPPG